MKFEDNCNIFSSHHIEHTFHLLQSKYYSTLSTLFIFETIYHLFHPENNDIVVFGEVRLPQILLGKGRPRGQIGPEGPPLRVEHQPHVQLDPVGLEPIPGRLHHLKRGDLD